MTEKRMILEKPEIYAIDKDSDYKIWKIGNIEYSNGEKDILVDVQYNEEGENVVPKIDSKKEYPSLQEFLRFSYIEWTPV